MIRQLHAEGLSQTALAEMTGRDRKTIRKYLRDPGWTPAARPPRPATLAPYTAHLDARLAAGVANAVVLLVEIRRQGYTGGYTRVKDYVAPRRAAARVVATRRFETAPGHQAQVDWGAAGTRTDADGTVQALSAFTLVLGHSRALFADLVLDETLPTLLRMHEAAFTALGGVPRTLLYDNMKTVILGHDAHGDPLWQPAFADFARHWGFVPTVCHPYRPQTKGKVEAGVKYVKHSFLVGCTAETYDDARADLRTWLATVANVRVHGTTHQVVADALAAEQPHLQPLGSRQAYPYAPTADRRVTRDACVVVDTHRYSVPWRLAGLTVQVRQTDTWLEVLHGTACVARHAVATGRHQQVVEPAHHAGMPYGPGARTRPKPQVHLREAPPAVETRPLAAYQAVAEGGAYAGA